MRGFLLLTLAVAAVAVRPGGAMAHSFNVLLLAPLSGQQAEAGKKMRDGFMLATQERDGHAGQESDGHLGGLDVYVSVADAGGAGIVNPPASMNGLGYEIVVALDANRASSLPAGLEDAAVLSPGRTPFDNPSNHQADAIAAFVAAFQAAYGYEPSADAAQGYNAARRIEAAVRERGDASDAEYLQKRFDETRTDFDW